MRRTRSVLAAMQPASKAESPEGHDGRSDRVSACHATMAHRGLILALTVLYVAAGKPGS